MLIERIVNSYQEHSVDIHMTLNHEFATDQWQSDLSTLSNKVNITRNQYPEKGRFYSIKLGLSRIKECDYCFIHNVDNPISSATIKALIANKNDKGYTVPSFNDRNGHPILISKKIIADVLDWDDDDIINWKDFLGAYPKKIVNTNDANILVNLNTPMEYEGYLQVDGAYLH